MSFNNNKLIISWGILVINKQNVPVRVQDDQLVLNVLYETGMVPPVIQSADIWGSSSLDNREEQTILINGEKFSQVEVTLPLKPGDNLFFLEAHQGIFHRKEPFVIKREISDPEAVPVFYDLGVPLDQSSRENFEITQPGSGYVKIPVPGTLNFSGYLKEDSLGDNIFSLITYQLEGNEYREYEQVQLPAVKGLVSGEITFPHPGSYLLEVISPKYIPTSEQGTVGRRWAEIRVEVGNWAEGALFSRLDGTGIGLKDSHNLIIIDGNFLDLDQDGRKDEIYFVANPYEINDAYFSAPGYLIYATSPQEKFRYLELDFPPIDLYQGNIKIQYGDINNDQIPEIFYSVDYPQPEHVERWPHMLQYHRETGEFSDFDLTSQYQLIADWGVEKNSVNGETDLWMEIKKRLYDDTGIRRYFHMYQDRLVKRENYLRMTNPAISYEDDPVVAFPDGNLEQVIRKEIDKNEGPIYQSELKGITYLSGDNHGITNLAGMEYLVDLKELNLAGNNIDDLTPLKKLVNLEEVCLSRNKVYDLSPLKELKNLRVLDLSFCNITNIKSLPVMPSLFQLDLSYNKLTDLQPLAKLRTLQELFLDDNNIGKVEPLAQLTALQSLGLQDNKIKDVAPLKGLVNLEWLGIKGNPVKNLSVLSSLRNTSIY